MGNEESHPIQDQPADVKLQNGAANGHAGIPADGMGDGVACEVSVEQKCEPPPPNEASTPSVNEVDGSKEQPVSDAPEDPSQQPVKSVEAEASLECLKPESETPTELDPPQKEETPPKVEKKNFFGGVFKKKNKSKVEEEPPVVECNSPPEDPAPSEEAPVLVNGHSEPGDGEETTAEGKDSEDSSPNGTPAGGIALEVDGEAVLQVDAEVKEPVVEEKSPVMNFFRTLVSPTKPSKEEAAPPVVPAEEVKVSEVPEPKPEPEPEPEPEPSPVIPPADPVMEEPKAPKISVGSPFGKLFKSKSSKGAQPEPPAKEVDAPEPPKAATPPPPRVPPEPAKVEVKEELVVDSAPKEAPKDAVKEPEPASKPKPAKGMAFRMLFHPKEEEKQEEEEPQPVEEEEVTEKSEVKATEPEVPPSDSPKAEKKSGKPILISLFKPKTTITKVKEGKSVVTPAIAVDTAQPSSVKVEPRPATEADRKKIGKQEAAPAGGKAVSGASHSGEGSTSSLTRKLEKRNSIHMFFKRLAPKKQSEAGVQTEPVTICDPAK